MTVFTAQLGRETRWGTLGLGPSVGDLALLALFLFFFNTSPSSYDNFHWFDHDFLFGCFCR